MGTLSANVTARHGAAAEQPRQVASSAVGIDGQPLLRLSMILLDTLPDDARASDLEA